MPKMSSSGVPKKSELPATLRHSDAKAQRTFAKTYDSAMEEYDDEERAHQVAYDALKHTHEKVGDKWEPKSSPGPSDSQAKGGKNTDRPTAGGVDANATKDHLYQLATSLKIPGRSTMNKNELVEALERESNKQTKKNA
ncbi:MULTISPECIES: ChaB family protein [unclassified Brevibacterium]|uniref:ChaB family protein n=1 Tax=unclassified Brevibacterium TaxID=2614124 RepID=UPI000C68899C|nr:MULTISPECIES: ChaB family protein [unclassified Brevibacterium]SMY03556.1 Rho termination factor, N-terminal domain [Brevibacterium sp. 239c]